jgi:hypothetical protein
MNNSTGSAHLTLLAALPLSGLQLVSTVLISARLLASVSKHEQENQMTRAQLEEPKRTYPGTAACSCQPYAVATASHCVQLLRGSDGAYAHVDLIFTKECCDMSLLS